MQTQGSAVSRVLYVVCLCVLLQAFSVGAHFITTASGLTILGLYIKHEVRCVNHQVQPSTRAQYPTPGSNELPPPAGCVGHSGLGGDVTDDDATMVLLWCCYGAAMVPWVMDGLDPLCAHLCGLFGVSSRQ